MKKVLVVLMIIALILCSLPADIHKSDATSLFTDVPQNAWYYKNLEYISKDSRKIMEGYNGKFTPAGTLTVEQFLKCVTVASDFMAPPTKAGEKWSFPYIEMAVKMKLVQSGEFADFERGITRAEMARIIIRALPIITGETSISYDINTVKSRMGDYDSIPVALKDYICKAYQLGILNGGTDGKFNPNKTLVRAEAAAVIRRLVDKSARAAVVEENEVTEMWSDAEFEAFMKSTEVMDYVNIYPIVKIENRRIYWRSILRSGQSTLMPEENNPDVNNMVYNLFKIMAYHAIKTDGYLAVGYNDESKGGTLFSNFYVGKEDDHYLPSGAITLNIYSKPQNSPTATKFFPSKQKGDTHYEWILGAIRKKDALRGFEPGMDRSKFEWTAPCYEKIINDLFVEVYGTQQGNLFYNFAINELDEYFLTDDDYKSSYIGFKQNIGCELVYYTPERDIAGIRFSTDRPEVEK